MLATRYFKLECVLRIDYTASTDKETIINLTNHAYWNLSGVGGQDVLGHELIVQADSYMEMNRDFSPTGRFCDVGGTPFDFRVPRVIGERIGELRSSSFKGYDLAYSLRGAGGELQQAAQLSEPRSGRSMEIWTDRPALVLYTANYLTGSPVNGGYPQYAAVCLETEHFQDSPNHATFPTTILKAGDTFRSTTVYKFHSGENNQ